MILGQRRSLLNFLYKNNRSQLLSSFVFDAWPIALLLLFFSSGRVLPLISPCLGCVLDRCLVFAVFRDQYTEVVQALNIRDKLSMVI